VRVCVCVFVCVCVCEDARVRVFLQEEEKEKERDCAAERIMSNDNVKSYLVCMTLHLCIIMGHVFESCPTFESRPT